MPGQWQFRAELPKGIRDHKCNAATANTTQDCTLEVAAPDFEAEAGHISTAVQEVQCAQAEQEPVFQVHRLTKLFHQIAGSPLVNLHRFSWTSSMRQS